MARPGRWVWPLRALQLALALTLLDQLGLWGYVTPVGAVGLGAALLGKWAWTRLLAWEDEEEEEDEEDEEEGHVYVFPRAPPRPVLLGRRWAANAAAHPEPEEEEAARPESPTTRSPQVPPAEMYKDAVKFGTTAFEKHTRDEDIAAHIKKEFDKKYNPTWQCFLGRNDSFATHGIKQFMYFHVDGVPIFLFKYN